MDKAKKKRIKRYLLWLGMAALVLLLTAMPLLAQSEAEADGPQASLLSATVQTGSITTTLRGGGNLEDLDAEDVKLPTGVKITEFLVKNGDIVQKGTPLAAVDKTSVMAAITSVNETMEFLREEIEDSRNEKVDESLKAIPGGRVKKIFAKEGETVQEVMLRDGALAVLSIDSMMAVQIETVSTAGTGENLDVTLADGSVILGRVESNLDGKVVVTVEDEGYEVGQTVQVEGLGSGTLYIHNAWKVTGHAGTISKVKAKEEQTLSEGAVMFTLEDREFEGQLQHRANQHREYEELLQKLLAMYQSGTIDAPCEGVISGVDSDSPHLLAAVEDTWEVELLNSSGSGYQILFLADIQYTCSMPDVCGADGPHDPRCILSCTKNEICTAETHQDGCLKKCIDSGDPGTDCLADQHNLTCIESCTHAKDPTKCLATGAHYPDCIKSCTKDENCRSSVHFDDCITLCIRSDTQGKCTAKTHRTSCIESCAEAQSAADPCPADDHRHKTNCIESCIVSKSVEDVCPASVHQDGCEYKEMQYFAKAAYVQDIAPQDGVLKCYVDTATTYTLTKDKSGWKPDKPLSKTFTQPMDVPVSNISGFGKGAIIWIIDCYKGDTYKGRIVEVYIPGSGAGTGTGGFPGGMDFDFSGLLGDMDLSALMGGMDLSGMMGGFAGFGNYSGMMGQQETETLHDLEGSTLLTVTPHKTMKLPITLDEQDIAKVSVGMAATVKVEALKNQEFSAKVTNVGIAGTNSGGSSKYTVDLELSVQTDMLPGMSAAASLPLYTKEDVIQIPVAALNRKDGKTMVYTALDAKTGEPASPVEIETGLSDGELVEVTAGLAEGQTVYYFYYDTLQEDTSAEAERFTFG